MYTDPKNPTRRPRDRTVRDQDGSIRVPGLVMQPVFCPDPTQEQGQTQAPPTPASPSEAATTAALASAPATNSTIVGTKRKPPAHKSIVWDHFDKLPVDENNPEARAKCRGQEKKKPMLAFLQQPSTVGSCPTKSLVPHTYNVEECRKSLAEFVICDEMPFCVVEVPTIVEFVAEAKAEADAAVVAASEGDAGVGGA
ncbi:zinc finger BED domain-containing protein RICESLEEPER 2-like [Senna tora]|uniref:Zinc finger BED domain-containing protein RICESLEEPER 2-like n=1 Tax=Senna tora TaxID=362788 RepID=A0A834TWD0_9FABA|nr:zinc finger BED domain-containing protein RICESLEEPER 2-like [Senna tora]